MARFFVAFEKTFSMEISEDKASQLKENMKGGKQARDEATDKVTVTSSFTLLKELDDLTRNQCHITLQITPPPKLKHLEQNQLYSTSPHTHIPISS